MNTNADGFYIGRNITKKNSKNTNLVLKHRLTANVFIINGKYIDYMTYRYILAFTINKTNKYMYIIFLIIHVSLQD